MDFDFKADYRLENEFVSLIPLREDHFESLLPFALNEPSLWTYSLLSAAGEENMKKYLHKALEGRGNQTAYPFIVWDKRKKQFAGSTRLYDISLEQKVASLGYTWYGKDFQGTGLNKNCKFLLLQFAFEKMGVERVEFRADANNARSIAAMKSIGCTEEGILRSNCMTANGNRRDSIVLSILKSEWENEIKKKLLARCQ